MVREIDSMKKGGAGVRSNSNPVNIGKNGSTHSLTAQQGQVTDTRFKGSPFAMSNSHFTFRGR